MRQKDWILVKHSGYSCFNTVSGANQTAWQYRRPGPDCSTKKKREDYEYAYKITIEGEIVLLVDYMVMGNFKWQALI